MEAPGGDGLRHAVITAELTHEEGVREAAGWAERKSSVRHTGKAGLAEMMLMKCGSKEPRRPMKGKEFLQLH